MVALEPETQGGRKRRFEILNGVILFCKTTDDICGDHKRGVVGQICSSVLYTYG